MESIPDRHAPARPAVPRCLPRLPWRRVAGFALASIALHVWLLRDAVRLGAGQPASRGIEVVGVTILPASAQSAAPQARSLPAPASAPEAASPPRPRASRPAVVPRPAAVDASAARPLAPQAPPPATPGPADAPDDLASAQAAPDARLDATGQPVSAASADAPGARQDGTRADDRASAEAAADAIREAAAAEAGTGPQAALPGAPPLPPPPAQALWRYRVYSGDYLEDRQVASMDYRFSHDGRRYRFTLAGRAEGLTAWLYSGALVQTSEGTIGGAGLQPERYAEQRGKRAERAFAVDRVRRELVRGDDPRLPVPPGAQDRLSSLVQLGLLARAMPERVVAGAVLELPELSFSGIETVRYRSAGRVVLALPGGGEMPALHLVRERGPSDREPGVEVWLGYDHALLPVRVRLTDAGGRVLDQFLQGS